MTDRKMTDAKNLKGLKKTMKLLKPGMDNANKKVADVVINAISEGKSEKEVTKTWVESMFKHPETGQSLTYSEMRRFFG